MDFYVILGLERGATLNDIKRAYRRLARRFHPDINPGDDVAEAQFRRISEAYETLIDPDRRRQYDVSGLTSSPEPNGIAFGFDGFDFSVRVTGTSAPTFGDLFADVLVPADGTRTVRIERGADLHQDVTLTFDEAFQGATRNLAVTRRGRCRTCRGTGKVATAESRCMPCGGAGAIRSTRGHMVFSKPCNRCGGTGRHVQAVCPTCGGHQTEMRTEPVTISVPAGLADGARVRVAGKGHTGLNGGENGDLLIGVHVEPHPLFRRDADGLHITVPVAIHEAALGARIEVPAPDGPARVRVPPGTRSGQRFRVSERGMPSPRTGRRGDLVVEATLTLPEVLDERSKELLREFGRINAADQIRRGVS
jgi:molecular chaperone DnaJ